MKNCKKSAFLSFLLIFTIVFSSFFCFAEEGSTDAAKIADGIINSCGASSPQEFVGVVLPERVGSDAEWYIFAITHYCRNADYSAYLDSLDTYLSENTVASATTRLKFALAMIAAGDRDNEYISRTLEDSAGKQGIMSFVFALHVINNLENEEERAEEQIKSILDMRKSDGGWAVTGSFFDVDVTAMTLQALTPYYESDTEVKNAADKALALLSEKQRENGGYSSYGAENAESCSQVMIALCSLGIDPMTDERFIKNGNTVLDGLLQYKNADGGFSHFKGGENNRLSTAEAFCALISLTSLQNGGGGLFDFDLNVPDDPPDPDDPPKPDDPEETGSEAPDGTSASPVTEPATDKEPSDPDTSFADKDKSENTAKRKSSYKTPAIITVVSLVAVLFIIFAIRKKSYKSYLFTALIAIALILAVIFTNISTPEEYYAPPPEKENVIGKVTLSIRCDAVLDKYDNDLPKEGILLGPVEFDISEGESVYDLLIEAAKTYGLKIDSKGSGGTAYIAGISNLYEYQFGDLSGWVYFVNGKMPPVGCGSYILSVGDTILWAYSTDLGNDIDPHK